MIHLSQDVSTKTLSSASQIFLYPHYIGTEAELFSRLKYWHEKLLHGDSFHWQSSELICLYQLFNIKQQNPESFSKMCRKTFLIKMVLSNNHYLFCTKYYMKAESGLKKVLNTLHFASEFENIIRPNSSQTSTFNYILAFLMHENPT